MPADLLAAHTALDRALDACYGLKKPFASEAKRVNSYQATQFRIWATRTLKEFIIKGFVLDDERLKQGRRFGKDYFDELLDRIREIRASERRFYQKITDLYAQCSVDYDPKSDITQQFYKTVENKLEWAITGKTAAENVAARANAALHSFKPAIHPLPRIKSNTPLIKVSG